MWNLIALGVGLSVLIWLFIAVSRYRDGALAVLCFALWLRYFSSAFHDITYSPVAAGLTLNALLSLATVGLCAFFIDLRSLLSRFSLAIYPIVIATAVSGALNGMVKEAIEPLTKWAYFLMIALLARDTMKRHGPGAVFRLSSIALLTPVILQYVSIALNNPKDPGDTDLEVLTTHGVNYIGGYYHEAVFSVILLTFLFVSMNAKPVLSRAGRMLSVTSAVIGLYFANYRTSLLSAVPAIAAFFLTSLSANTSRRYKALAIYAVVVLGIGAAFFTPKSYLEKFADVPSLITQLNLITQHPSEFSTEQRKLLTGRVYIWSEYLSAFREGNLQERFFGHGPNSWEGRFRLYAHNTFVSTLYEYGIVGLTAVVFLFLQITFGSLSAGRNPEIRHLFSMWLCFLILNMATMPLWQIEGMILFALIRAASEMQPQRAYQPTTRLAPV